MNKENPVGFHMIKCHRCARPVVEEDTVSCSLCVKDVCPECREVKEACVFCESNDDHCCVDCNDCLKIRGIWHCEVHSEHIY